LGRKDVCVFLLLFIFKFVFLAREDEVFMFSILPCSCSRWSEFEDGYLHFNNWLKETETYLRSELDFKATLDEKKQHWEQYQVGC